MYESYVAYDGSGHSSSVFAYIYNVTMIRFTECVKQIKKYLVNTPCLIYFYITV